MVVSAVDVAGRYVFDGGVTAAGPYSEEDAPAPLNAYAAARGHMRDSVTLRLHD